jgi:hypothetical protein
VWTSLRTSAYLVVIRGDDSQQRFIARETPEGVWQIGLSHWTLYKWIRDARLNQARGLRRLGSRRLIDWPVFKAAIEAGEFSDDAGLGPRYGEEQWKRTTERRPA